MTSTTPDWKTKAKCRGRGPFLFYGAVDETIQQRKAREAEAKLLCRLCDVAGECRLAGAEEEGIWGGTTEAERRWSGPVVSYIPARVDSETIQHTPPADWKMLEAHRAIKLFQRPNPETWHGYEWIVVKGAEVVLRTANMESAYLRYGSLIDTSRGNDA